jgi:hypothetical protein
MLGTSRSVSLGEEGTGAPGPDRWANVGNLGGAQGGPTRNSVDMDKPLSRRIAHLGPGAERKPAGRQRLTPARRCFLNRVTKLE